MDEKEWLASLKVGDKVAVDNNSLYTDSKYKLGTVTKITPTRQIQIDGHDPKFKDGFVRYDSWHSCRIYPLTEDKKEDILRGKILNRLSGFKFEKLSTEKLRKVWEILKEE